MADNSADDLASIQPQNNDQSPVYQILLSTNADDASNSVLIPTEAIQQLLTPKNEALPVSTQLSSSQPQRQLKLLSPSQETSSVEDSHGEVTVGLSTTYIEIQQIEDESETAVPQLTPSKLDKKSTSSDHPAKITPRRKAEIKKHSPPKPIQALPALKTGSVVSLSSLVAPQSTTLLSSLDQAQEAPQVQTIIEQSTVPLGNEEMPLASSSKLTDTHRYLSPMRLANASLGNQVVSEAVGSTSETASLLPSAYVSSVLPRSTSVLDQSSEVISMSSSGSGEQKDIPYQPVMILEGGLANLAALQAGIHPVPFSILPKGLTPKQSKPRQASRNTPVHIIPKPVMSQLPVTSNRPISEQPSIISTADDNQSHMNAFIDNHTGVVMDPSLEESASQVIDSQESQLSQSNITDFTSGEDKAGEALTCEEEEEFLADVGSEEQQGSPEEAADAFTDAKEELAIFSEANDKKSSSATEKHKTVTKDEVFEEIKVTLKSSITKALPKNSSSYLESLAGLHNASLLAVPGEDSYTLTCQSLSDLVNIHSTLSQLIGCENKIKSLGEMLHPCSEAKEKIYTGRKRGRKKAVELSVSHQQTADEEQEDTDCNQDVKKEENARFSRSGRRLKLRRLDTGDEYVNSDSSSLSKTPKVNNTAQGVKRPVGRPRKNMPDNTEVLKEPEEAADAEVKSDEDVDSAIETKLVTDELLEAASLQEKDDVDEDEDTETKAEIETDGDKDETKIVLGRAHLKKKDYEAEAPYKYFCKKCSFKSKRPSHMEKHMALHESSSTLWRCSKCSFTTLRLNHLRRHEQEHSNLTQLSCTKCKYKCWKQELLVKHFETKHRNDNNSKPDDRPILSCSHCDYKTQQPHLFMRHKKVHMIPQKNTLNKPAIKTLPSDYLNHIMRTFRCTECSYVSHRKEHFVRHMADKHGSSPRPYLCDTCGRSFKRRDSLKQHAVVHQDKSNRKFQFKCPVCGKGLRSRAHLTEHMTKHSNTRAYLCEICGASFKTPSVQKKHVLSIHKNPDSFPCKSCPKMFNTKFSLLRHERMHSAQEKKLLAQKRQNEECIEQTEVQEDVASHSIVLSQLGSELTQTNEVVLPEFTDDAAQVHSLKIELPNGDVYTQPVIEINSNVRVDEELSGQTPASILQQMTSQSNVLQQTEGTTALLYFNTSSL